ncbi:MAG: RNA ligase family protein [Pirellulaceae bacterium]|nr:RNA ligase family protein [Pirellulaceae bacterium]
MTTIRKYPRTHHLEGSRLQAGDEDLSAVRFDEIADRHLVVEEKVDGANCGLSFAADGTLRLQSRGHFLTGGGREKHFALFKQWAETHRAVLWDRLGDRFVVYGEWLYAKHTVYYNALPHYFLEFDVFDVRNDEFLSTQRRRELLFGAPIEPVPVLRTGRFAERGELTCLIGRSAFIGDAHLERLGEAARSQGSDADQVLRETDLSNQMEGLYIKVEEDGQVVRRLKFIRASFLTAVVESETHWLNRPIIANRLRDGVDLFAEQLNRHA